MITSGIYLGTITEVFPPSHSFNDSEGYQYVYEVVVATDMYSYLPVRCVKMDLGCGGIYNYDDLILNVGQVVYIGFPFLDTARGVILGGKRSEPSPQEEDGAIRAKRRFNEINQSISFKGVWKLEHLSKLIPVGPSITLDKDKILINDGGISGQSGDSTAQSIEIDARNNTIKINSGEWTIQATKGVTINVTAGDVKVSCINATVDAKQNAKVTAKMNVDVEAGVNATVKAKVNATVEATQILLNSKGLPLDGVITTTTQPACYVTGIPFRGSLSVLAGA